MSRKLQPLNKDLLNAHLSSKVPVLHHTLTGPAAAPALLFLHGFMGSSADWEAITADLESDYRCLAVDLPGHGRSLHYPDDDLYTIPGAASALLSVLDEHDIAQCHVAGYSMGGRVALYFALHHPDRCRRLVLESASPGLDKDDARRERRKVDRQRAERIARGDFEAFLNEWYRQPLFESLARHELVDEMVATRLRNDRDELACAVVGMSPGRQPPLWDRLGTLAVPVLALSGQLDDKYAALTTRLETASPLIHTALVPGAGHNVHAERPRAYLEAVRAFL